jgi:hypothetical protein
MGSEFTFYDFVDDSGTNLIHQWLQGIPKGAKQKFNKWLMHLEATPPGEWRRPLVDTVCDGLREIRVSFGQQYRILAVHTPDRKPILLHSFIKSGRRVPKGECDRARVKKDQVEADPAKHTVEHNYE